MKKILYFIFIGILALLCISFAGFNSGQIVSVKFIGLRLENEFWVFVIAALLIGMILGYLFAVSSLLKKSVHSRSLNKKLIKAEKKISDMANQTSH